MEQHDIQNQALVARLAEAAERSGVVGAGLVMSCNAALTEVYFGTLNGAEPVTPNTRFRIGSITKMWTSAMLLAQGVDADQHVSDALPEFRLHESVQTSAIKLKHLMNHHAGFFADSYTLSDGGDNTAEAYVRGLRHSLPLAPVGQLHSYGNAHSAVLGRLLEVCAGKTYVEAFGAFAKSLGLHDSGGTVPDGPNEGFAAQFDLNGERLEPEPKLIGLIPAGATAWSTARDLNTFGRAFLNDGPLASVFETMRAEMKAGPCSTFATSWGLGLMGYDLDRRVFGHHGVVPGQRAFLKIVPDQNMTFALQCTGGDGAHLAEALLTPLIEEMTGARCDVAPDLVPERVDTDVYVGTYAHQYASIRVFLDDGRLRMSITPIHHHSPIEPETLDLVPKGNDLVAALHPTSRLPLYHRFIPRIDGDGIGWFNFRGCLFPRLSST